MSWMNLTSCSYLEFQLTHYCVISLLWYKQCTPQANMIFCYSEKQSLNCRPMGFLMTTTNMLVSSKHILVRHCLTTANTHTHTQPFNGFVRDNLGRPVPDETLTHSHPTWSLDILYHLPPFTTIHGILFVHFTLTQQTDTYLLFGPDKYFISYLYSFEIYLYYHLWYEWYLCQPIYVLLPTVLLSFYIWFFTNFLLRVICGRLSWQIINISANIMCS